MSNRAVPSLPVNHRAEIQPEAPVNHPKPAKRQRIPAPQCIRVMQKYALGKNQKQIAHEERLNRETVHRIVHSSEMNEFVEEMRAHFRGLAELAIEALRRELQQGGKEAIEIAWRVLDSNGIIPPKGQAVNYSAEPPDAQAIEDEAVQRTLTMFGRIGMERGRVFNTPFPELEEAAEQAGVENPTAGFSEPSLRGDYGTAPPPGQRVAIAHPMMRQAGKHSKSHNGNPIL